MKLSPGDSAPLIQRLDFEGQDFDTDQYKGRWLLLSFYRYASCPFCNLRIHQLDQETEHFRELNLEMAAVFQSSAEKVESYAGSKGLSFPLLCDPSQGLYQTYGLTTSWWGFFGGMVLKMPKMMVAFKNGFLPGSMEGKINQMPADFLIDPNGIIQLAYYGSDLSDHVPVEQIKAVLTK